MSARQGAEGPLDGSDLAPGPRPQVPPLTANSTAVPEPEQPKPKAAGVKKVTLDETTVSILDLRELPSSRFRIVGSAFWVTDSGRYKNGGNEYLLVREPKNKWDANAVAVYGNGRKVGHLSEAKAGALAPIFDEPAFDAYRVGGAPPASNSIIMWVACMSLAGRPFRAENVLVVACRRRDSMVR